MAQEDKYAALRLDNQLCFPLYACAREVIRRYHPFLQELGLTYTQYIAMMVLWEERQTSVKALGKRLYLDSGTLTPLLKSLEQKGWITRARSKEDERVLIVSLTESGLALQDEALSVPGKIAQCIHLDPAEAVQLYTLLHKVLEE